MGTAAQKRAGLLKKELNRFIREVPEKIGAERVLVFGSLAQNTFHEWSDLDVVVIAHSTVPFMDRIGQILKQFRPRVGLDLLVYTPEEWDRLVKESSFVKEEIIKKGKVVYERPK
ncbi:MAG: nucleotidyltransferase domain-containing protein [Clostridia bacterium]|nr:nucleotidyltransferase domain-containing protein [Clostridia bacterium]